MSRTDERKETEEREREREMVREGGIKKFKKMSEGKENILLLETGEGNKPLRTQKTDKNEAK